MASNTNLVQLSLPSPVQVSPRGGSLCLRLPSKHPIHYARVSRAIFETGNCAAKDKPSQSGYVTTYRAERGAALHPSELRNAGLKITGPRLKILEILSTAQPRHMSAIAIYRHLRQAQMEIGLATVYRVLTQFSEAGLVTSHHFEGSTAVYELNEGLHHDHIVCLDCGRVQEFVDPGVEERQSAIAAAHQFEIRDRSMILYGACLRKNCPSKVSDETGDLEKTNRTEPQD